MTWKLRIPHRGRDEPLDPRAVSELQLALDDPEERAVARKLMLDAMFAGTETVGGLLDSLAALTPAERRQKLDEARQSAGLPDTETIDVRRKAEAFQRATAHLQPRDEHGYTFMSCAHPTCAAHPANHVGAMIATEDVKAMVVRCPSRPGSTGRHGSVDIAHPLLGMRRD